MSVQGTMMDELRACMDRFADISDRYGFDDLVHDLRGSAEFRTDRTSAAVRDALDRHDEARIALLDELSEVAGGMEGI